MVNSKLPSPSHFPLTVMTSPSNQPLTGFRSLSHFRNSGLPSPSNFPLTSHYTLNWLPSLGYFPLNWLPSPSHFPLTGFSKIKIYFDFLSLDNLKDNTNNTQQLTRINNLKIVNKKVLDICDINWTCRNVKVSFFI